jgi:hypothetical protein
MSTLPNILPATGGNPFTDGEAGAFPGTSENIGVPFDHLMADALSSNAAGAPVEQNQPVIKNMGDSSPPVKSSKSVPKTAGGNSDMVADPSVTSAANPMSVNPENVLVQIIAPTTGNTDQKNETNAKAAAAGKSADFLPVLPAVKNLSTADIKVSSPAAAQSGPEIETNPAVKSDGQEKITAAVEALAVEKANSTDAKITGATADIPAAPPSGKSAAGDLLMSKPAIESVAQASQPGFSPSPDLTAQVAAQAEPDVNGTPAAQQDVPMNKTEKPNKTASPAGKILPGTAFSAARENNLPSRENFSAQTLARSAQVAASVAANSSQFDNTTDAAQLSADAAGLIGDAAKVDFRARALERVQDMIVQHATRLSDLGYDLLQVVVKPGAGTQLSLELRQRGDGVEAQAVLQRGDFNHLNQQWPALQQQLEQRGIRLAPLIADGNFAGGGENNFQHNKNQPAEPDVFPAGIFAGTATAGSVAQATVGAGTHRGWESWA